MPSFYSRGFKKGMGSTLEARENVVDACPLSLHLPRQRWFLISISPPPPFLIKTPYTRIGYETLCIKRDSFACLPRAPVKQEVRDLQNKLVDKHSQNSQVKGWQIFPGKFFYLLTAKWVTYFNCQWYMIKSYMNCGNEMKMKKWSWQWTLFYFNCRC